MSVRRLIVEIDPRDVNVTEFCAQHGVSTWFFYQLRKRYASEGEAALEPKSRAPKTVANRTPDWIENLVVEKRKELNDSGWDAGPATIQTHLLRSLSVGTVPSEATIWRILTRRGFIIPQPEKAPKHAYRSFAAERANECWQVDDIGYELAGGVQTRIITMIDDCTRLCPGLKAAHSVTGETAFEAFSTAAGQWGWPERFLSDNANAYKKTLASALRHLGVSARHGRPHHPQTQGKVERFHQTLQKWLNVQPRPATLNELQTQLDEFVDYYNNQRPHRAINRRTPASVWNQTPKTGPVDRPLTAATSIHRVTVSEAICYINKDYSIVVGAAHNQQPATIIITGLNCHVFIAGRLIRQLQLNPTRRYQALYDRPGRP